MVTRIAAAALVAALSACGGLTTPDLSRGAVSGRISGAAVPGAYAYVYGAPQLQAALAGDGSFEIAGVPVGPASVVLYDGSARAEMVAVEVLGATRTRIDRTAALMPLAGRIVAAARPQGGTIGTGASYTVGGTVLAGMPAQPTALSVELWPLPGGSFMVWAALPGFLPLATPVTVLAGATVTAEADLNVDPPDPEHGCVNKNCHAPLVCDGSDGWCYECVATSDCTAGRTCEAHACVAAPATGLRQICDPCTADADCAGPSGLCFSGDPAGPYCSQTCTADANCPAGFACSGNACVAPRGCASLTATFNAPCLENGACDDSLRGGVCAGLVPGPVGYCSAPCLVAADCSAAVGLPYCPAGSCAP